MDRIEQSCAVILEELKQGRFSLRQLEMLDELFSQMVQATNKLIDKAKRASNAE